ncbi:MAG: GldG family protein [Oscillospiraceae bacterium]|nr:GldG family protein [Oscillospiraceae bacterium]
MNFFKSRKFRHGTAATVFTILIVVLVVIANMVATALSERYNMTLDLTEGGVFTLSRESLDFLRAVEKDVNIYVLTEEDAFVSRGQYFIQANEVIKRYAQQQPRITLRYVDIVRDPTFVTRFPALTLDTGNVLVECEGRTALLTAADLFNTRTDENMRTGITSSRAEQALSSAILNVTSEKKVIVSILGGHNQMPAEDFAALLQTNNYEIIYQNLMTEEIHPDAVVAVMNAPSRDISENEARKLDAFLHNDEQLGRMLFYLASAAQPDRLPVLDALLEEWGIKINPGVVYETDFSRLFHMNPFMTIADYTEEELSRSVREKRIYPAMANSRPIEILFESRGSVATTQLMQFSAGAGVMPPDAEEDWMPDSPSGPIPALVMAQKSRYERFDLLTSTVLAGGSETFVDGYLLGQTSLANSEYILGLVHSLSGRDDVVVIQSKTIQYRQLPITANQVIGISVVLAIIFPVLVLAFGIVVWLRRRHK